MLLNKNSDTMAVNAVKSITSVKTSNKLRVKPTQIIVLSFVFMIVLGGILLMLPISSNSGKGLHPIDAFFVSTSASCVTGLTVVDLKNDLTFFGKCVMLFLIQIGGLGIMTLATLVVYNMGYRFRLKESLILQESLNQTSRAGLFDLVRHIILYTFVVEGIFAVLLALHFYPEFGFDAIGYGIFHSVSAFCNAGFDLFGNYDSLVKRTDDYFLMSLIGFLIILGGIGFTVVYDILQKKVPKKYTLHTKIVLVSNLALIIIGAFLIFIVEVNNKATLGEVSVFNGIAQSIFTSVSCRTAGFNTFDLSAATQITQLVMIIIMFIGASPLSTGGGVKCTTIFIVICSVISIFRKEKELTIFGRTINQELRNQAFAIFTVGVIWVITTGMILSAIDGKTHELEEVIFETVSAFATVGMGIGITLDWNEWGKILLMLTMLLGRVGIMTFMLSFITQKSSDIKYPNENIMIG